MSNHLDEFWLDLLKEMLQQPAERQRLLRLWRLPLKEGAAQFRAYIREQGGLLETVQGISLLRHLAGLLTYAIQETDWNALWPRLVELVVESSQLDNLLLAFDVQLSREARQAIGEVAEGRAYLTLRVASNLLNYKDRHFEWCELSELRAEAHSVLERDPDAALHLQVSYYATPIGVVAATAESDAAAESILQIRSTMAQG